MSRFLIRAAGSWFGILVLVVGTAAAQEAPPASPGSVDNPVPEAVFKSEGQPEGESPGQAPPTAEEAAVKTESRLRFYSSAPGGEAGLLNVIEAGGGPAGILRISLHGGFFNSDEFLKYDARWTDYSESQVIGRLSLAFTPLPFLEVFANLRNSANKNSASKPQLLQTQGDLEFGAKGYYGVLPYLSVGLDLAVGFYNGIGEVIPKLDSTGIRTNLLATFDLRPLAPEIPLRAHLNIGMIFENSDNLREQRDLTYIEQFALRVNRYHRFAVGFGLDSPLPYADPVAIVPFLEYSLQYPIDISAADLALGSLGQDTALVNVLSMRLTPGVRVTYLRDITLDIAVDFSIGGKKAYLNGVPSTPPYTVWIGLTYAWDPLKRGETETKIVEKEVEKIVEKPIPAATSTGRIAGRVINVADQTPIPGAIVSFEGGMITPVATDEMEGRYTTYDLTAGMVRLTAHREGFKPQTQEAEVKVGEMTLLDFALEPEIKKGTLNGTVTNEKDRGLVAKVDILGPAEFHLDSAGDTGTFAADIPPGSYNVKVSADGYLAKGRVLQVKERQTVVAEFKLTPAPKQRIVVVEKNQIVVHKKIHFETGKAKITTDSFAILDSVIDVLVTHAEIKKVRVDGHTDSQGAKAMNTKLSQARADAVRDYLIQQGIPDTKLESKGFGPEKPIAPNSTLRGREQNRRVEFTILEQ